MRSITALTVVATATVAVSAQNCNPSYNVAGSGECFTNCNINAGNTFMSGWTIDHTSPKFLDSLKLMCTKGTPEYTAFMTKAGMCMAGCKDDPELFNAEFSGACGWYAQHKSDICDTNTAATTTAAPATTTAIPVATTTTAASASTTSAASATISSSAVPSAPAASGAPSIASAASSVTSISPANAASSASAPKAAQTGNSASKLQLSVYTVALIAGAGYLAL